MKCLVCTKRKAEVAHPIFIKICLRCKEILQRRQEILEAERRILKEE